MSGEFDTQMAEAMDDVLSVFGTSGCTLTLADGSVRTVTADLGVEKSDELVGAGAAGGERADRTVRSITLKAADAAGLSRGATLTTPDGEVYALDAITAADGAAVTATFLRRRRHRQEAGGTREMRIPA